MERASKLIRGLRLSGDVITPEQLCCAAWPEAVGKKIAGHTRAAKLVRTRLVVEVEDRIWQRQLFGLTPHILSNLDNTLGRGLVDELEFRIVPRRREPDVAPTRGTGALADDADAIADPSCATSTSSPEKGTSVKITEKEVRYVAAFANLTLSDGRRTDCRPISTASWNIWTGSTKSIRSGVRTHGAGAVR